jgi:wyosine [tRNA(Phe)-imidazoG37] synthetase (radical SAM superfamily)
MSTFLFSEHVFGPIQSRRLGFSLGINLLSVNQKVCNYNCIYCECGLTHQLTKEESVFVDKQHLMCLLDEKLADCIKNDTPIDTITFAGNGEPTMHPDFLPIVNEIVLRRNKLFPNAKIAVLTNGVTLDRKPIQAALKNVDKAIIKLDGGNNKTLQEIDQPKGKFDIDTLMKNIASFQGETIIQTMFLKGEINGHKIDNSIGEERLNWLEKIQTLQPKEVMLYSIDRDTPFTTLHPVSKTVLNEIAELVNEMGIPTQVV